MLHLQGLLLALVLSCVEASSTTSGLHLGVALNPFNRYGFLSISVRVVPRNDSEDKGWMFREPTVQVFSPDSLVPVPPRPERSNANVPLQVTTLLHVHGTERPVLSSDVLILFK